MRKRLTIYLGFLIISLIITTKSFAQITQLQHICSLYFSPEYISDGQEYFAQLKPDQRIEFQTTFFGENTYRIVACTNLRGTDVVFSVFDTEKNLLFTNANHDYSPYWDFRFTSTVTCIVQVDVRGRKFVPGYVMMLIGYKP